MHILLAAILLLLASCHGGDEGTAEASKGNGAPERMVAPILASPQARDVHSHARPEIARVTHVALDLNADFEARRLNGTATLDIAARDDAREIVLDSRGLDIRAVTDGAGRPLQYIAGESDPVIGTPLAVRMGEARRIVITYASAPNAPALQWLEPQQTAGGVHPYLLSQGQAILNRSWIPTQDSPGIRQTWEARITAPEPLKVVMSGENLAPEGEPAPDGRRAFRFRMDKPVAPYLIAIAAGDIAFRPLGPRTGVWTEPAMLDAVAEELADTEEMVAAAERLYGPYRWGRYDMIVLPPSFPFGGMENPMLTFLTPTMIAGDRSLVSLIAHELAHSWSGNLVTNAAWADFWLNEGFTTYFQGRIMEEVYGRRRAAQETALGWDDLQATLDSMGRDAPSTALHLNLAGRDPDDGMTDIAYEKGAAFLRTIESVIGRARWDEYLRSWFDRHAFQPATAAMFLADFREHVVAGDAALERRLDLDRWVYAPGLPDNIARPDANAFGAVDQQARAFGRGGLVSALGFADWTTAERLRFLNGLPREIEPDRLAALDETFGLSQSANSEVLFAWLQLALAHRYAPAIPAAERFLASMGRRKFVAPLFQTLVNQGEWGRPVAARIYARTRPLYHAVTRATVDPIVGHRPDRS